MADPKPQTCPVETDAKNELTSHEADVEGDKCVVPLPNNDIANDSSADVGCIALSMTENSCSDSDSISRSLSCGDQNMECKPQEHVTCQSENDCKLHGDLDTDLDEGQSPVNGDAKNKDIKGVDIDIASCQGKSLKLHIPQNISPVSVTTNSTQESPLSDSVSGVSPDSGKRRRVQHDYRRLSSSGYVDDYETGKDSRFTSPTEADILPISPGKSSRTVSPQTRSPVVGCKLSPSNQSATFSLSSAEATTTETSHGETTKLCEYGSRFLDLLEMTH